MPRPATTTDVADVVALVQSAYRGDASRAGWTTEADLLGGQRVDEEMVRALVVRPGSTVLVLDGTDDDGALVACCHVEQRTDDTWYVGMLAVRPAAQARGLGRVMLAAAEEHARRDGARRLEMTVIAQRAELIAWYERHGFADTGERSPFPYGDERYGLPQRPDLEFRHLARSLPAG